MYKRQLLYAAIVVVLVLIALAAGFYVGYKRGGGNVEKLLTDYNTNCNTYINGLKDWEEKYKALQDTLAANVAAEEAKEQAAAAKEEAKKQAAEAAKMAKQAFREQIVVNVIACNWVEVQRLLKNKDYVTPAERTAISSFYWDGEKDGKKGASRPAPQQKKINKAITENSSKLKTIEDIVAFYQSDAIKSKIE